MSRWTKGTLAILGAVVCSLTLAQTGWAQPTPEQAATTAAESWLVLCDQAKYPESWDAGAKAFQTAVSREKWTDALTAVRAPLGKVLSRTVKSAQYTTTLPGAPDGKYVVVQFTTSFEHKKEATETVTPMLEADGAWKVAGYFIR